MSQASDEHSAAERLTDARVTGHGEGQDHALLEVARILGWTLAGAPTEVLDRLALVRERHPEVFAAPADGAGP